MTATETTPYYTLYVDCDNTLISWKYAYTLRGDQLWEVNLSVVAAMERWQARGGHVVVWSEKGSDYARDWAARAAPHLLVSTERKDLDKPVPGDAAIDDVSLSTRCVCYRPPESMLVAPAPTTLRSH